jgi:hypothetical protein
MRRTIGVLAIAMALVLGSLTLASANTSGHRSDDDRVKTLHLLAETVEDVFLDLGEPGDSLGDQNVFTDNLFRNGKRVGELHVVCTLTRLVERVSATAQCLGTLVLPAGQITFQAALTFTEDATRFTLAITGGTGAYRTAHGQIRVHEISDTEARLTVRLIL